MIEQFVKDLAKCTISEIVGLETTNKEFKIVLKIFYDYCTEHDSPLTAALKYMIDHDKRPEWEYPIGFYWQESDDNCYWCLSPDLYNKMYPYRYDAIVTYKTTEYEKLLLDLAKALK